MTDTAIAGAVEYQITVHCPLCDSDLVIDLETTHTTKGSKRGPCTTTTGHHVDCPHHPKRSSWLRRRRSSTS